MSRKNLIAPVLLAVLLAAMIVSIFATTGDLPNQPATHFDEQGLPNGWMSKSGFLAFTLGMAVATIAFMLTIFWAIRFVPASMINLPNRDHWLSTEQRSRTFADLLNWGVELAIGVTALQAYLYFAIVRANQLTPPKLSSAVWVATALFLAFVVIQIIRLFRRFTKPAK